MTWTAHYFDPQLNRDAATRGFGSKDDALTAACDLIRRRCLVHFVQGPNEKIGAVAITAWYARTSGAAEIVNWGQKPASPKRAGFFPIAHGGTIVR